MALKIKSVGVLGLGVMGFDIAFLYAMKGYRTVAFDASRTVMESFPARVDQTIERLKRRNRISDDEVKNVTQGLEIAPATESMAELDLVTEAVSEVGKIKVQVYGALKKSGYTGILTTNTSSLPRAALVASGTYESQKFATTHFFNPVLYTRMVEAVKGDMAPDAWEITLGFLESLGRNAVETHDISGFVSNSILMYYAVMATHLLRHGAHIEKVDQIAKKLGLLPPFISFDSWKPSIVEDVTRVMFEFRGDGFLRSSPLLAELAQSNPRFYVEQKPNPEIYQEVGARAAGLSEERIQAALKTSIHVAAARVVELGEDPGRVDHISVEGIKIPEGPLKEIDRIGAAAVLDNLRNIANEMPDTSLTAPELLLQMAREGQTFYKGDQINPWVLSWKEI